MISRRLLLLSAAPLALGGCSANLQGKFASFAAKAYTDINVVAAFLESLIRKVIAGAITAASAAATFAAKGAPYIVPGCQIFEALVKLAGQLAGANASIGSNKDFVAIYGQATLLANNAEIQAAASSGVVPSDPVTVLTGVIQLASQIMTLTSGNASPTAAAAMA
jgi:hypothetical protein